MGNDERAEVVRRFYRAAADRDFEAAGRCFAETVPMNPTSFVPAALQSMRMSRDADAM